MYRFLVTPRYLQVFYIRGEREEGVEGKGCKVESVQRQTCMVRIERGKVVRDGRGDVWGNEGKVGK